MNKWTKPLPIRRSRRYKSTHNQIFSRVFRDPASGGYMKFNRSSVLAAVFSVVMIGMAAAASAQTTGTLTGTVKDAQGAVIPGATVTLISETRGTSVEQVSAPT